MYSLNMGVKGLKMLHWSDSLGHHCLAELIPITHRSRVAYLFRGPPVPLAQRRHHIEVVQIEFVQIFGFETQDDSAQLFHHHCGQLRRIAVAQMLVAGTQRALRDGLGYQSSKTNRWEMRLLFFTVPSIKLSSNAFLYPIPFVTGRELGSLFLHDGVMQFCRSITDWRLPTEVTPRTTDNDCCPCESYEHCHARAHVLMFITNSIHCKIAYGRAPAI